MMPQKRWAKAPQPLLNPPQLFEKRRAQSASAGPYEVPGLALVCQKCGGDVARYDATGSAWCDACCPGYIRFTVASHHWQKPPIWLADPHTFTIMAAPPPWTKANGRNEPLFAAPGELVFGNVTPEEYTKRFSAIMQKRLPEVRKWIKQHDRQYVTLLCACHTHNLEEKFCHRFLVAKLLKWLGCVEISWQAGTQTQRRAA